MRVPVSRFLVDMAHLRRITGLETAAPSVYARGSTLSRSRTSVAQGGENHYIMRSVRFRERPSGPHLLSDFDSNSRGVHTRGIPLGRKMQFPRRWKRALQDKFAAPLLRGRIRARQSLIVSRLRCAGSAC